ncbi:lysosome-associated membrane glycoprotein 1 isoform X5 [Etheostoma cragini]|uniref:lysosome-associated membrane glycoprotein 1 isoform X5 n=1 Tax=Etheostoma cragini TaxID=417921 RepID=UPI00155E3163|nr:lysosome-associated membrane glycoprotein 1 isoform X5 [Etheostoma cragini]
MKTVVVLAFLACLAVSALSLTEDEKINRRPATVSPAIEFSTNEHPPPPTTKSKTLTTTTPTTTTPTTTTHKPTTHKPTTHKPTTHKPTTPPQPTPPTNLTVGNYTVMANKTAVCVMAHMALQIRLATPKSNGTFIVQPKSTHAVGSCEATKANLTLEFPQGFITFMFNKSIEKNTVYVDAVSFSLNYPLDKKVANGPPYTANNKSMNLFAAKIGHSYSCKSEALYMGDGMYLDVNQDQMQAFNLNKNEFGKPDSCAADKPDYRVAIAVGVTLLVLIIIVVVVYLLGRRKRANGYQSL